MKLKELIRNQPNFKSKRTRAGSLIALSNAYNTKTNNQLYLEKLENILDVQNKNQDPQIDDHKQIIPGFQIHQLENKLWKFFQSKINNLEDKVQKEKINKWSNQMGIIVRAAKNKIRIKKECIDKLQLTISKKYKQSHEAYQELIMTKHQKGQNRLKSSGSKQNEDNFKQKIKLLKQNMNQLRLQAENHQNQLKKNQTDLKILQQQLLSFLKLLLKKGFYRQDGVRWILRELIELNYKPSKSDLPNVLDNSSKQCLIYQYENIKYGDKELLKKPQHIGQGLPQIKRKMIRSNSTGNQLQKINTKSLYHEMKSIIEQKVKTKDWNYNTNILLLRNQSKKYYQWRQPQKKRIIWAYNKQQGTKVIKILFGTNVDMLDILNFKI